MRYLLDTGILARLPHRADPLHPSVRAAVRKLTEAGHSLPMGTQNVAEFWNLCTRPADVRGGFGLSIEDTLRRLRLLERFVAVLKQPDSAYRNWKALVVAYRITGKQVHDARIAALMAAYRIKRIVTLNPRDFARYPGIEPLTPADVLNA